jgi:thymidine kinase
MLLTLAEDLEELKNVCACKSKATMNMRVDAHGNRVRSGPQVLIGDATYRPVCGSCFYD